MRRTRECLAERQTECRTRRADMLEGRRCGEPRHLLQLAHELPAVQCVEQIDVARPSVQHGKGQPAIGKDACGHLVRIAAVFEGEFVHVSAPFSLAAYRFSFIIS